MSPGSRGWFCQGDDYLGLCLIAMAILSSAATASIWEAMKEMDSRDYHQPESIVPEVSPDGRETAKQG